MAANDKTRIAKPSPIVEDEQGQLIAKKGISREVIEELSKVKGEPDWMRQMRVKSFEIFQRKPIPTWGVDLSDLDLDELVLYSPPEAGRYDNWDDVPAEMKQTYEDLGIPQAEREHLAGVVGVWRQEPVYEGLKKEYADMGILFTSMDTAITEYPDLVREYFMNKCVPPQDNKFSALHGAVWSGGSFLYVPPNVKVDLPLQAYFRMEGANEGTFEHTLIIVDEGAEVNYIEGCTAQTYSVNSMHSAVVEIFVKEGAKARYTTVQNWSKDVFNLVKVDLPLQAYFRMEGSGEGTFEHTLIIADEGSELNYIEGCTAQTYSVNSMHSAVVEIFVKEGAKARYTTVQNWSKDIYNLNTKRAIVEANGTVEWVGGSMGAKKVM